jgi:hypothetical protein
LNKLPMFEGAHCTDLSISEWIEERAVNVPSGISISEIVHYV